MNIDTPDTYVIRCAKALGQQMSDPAAIVHWCYDHPPCKAIPKANGERVREIRISRKVFACLRALGVVQDGGVTVDAVADALLANCVKDSAPGVWEFYERHAEQEAKLLAELRRNEPELQPQEEA